MALLAVFLSGNMVFAQKKVLQAKTFREIDSLIANPFEFPGKTESLIMATTRPARIIGEDRWEAEVFDKGSEKDPPGISKAIVIGTACGALMLAVSAKINLVFSITFIVHKKSKLNGMDLWDHLNGVNEFDLNAIAILERRNSTLWGLSVRASGIMSIAYKNDKGEISKKIKYIFGTLVLQCDNALT